MSDFQISQDEADKFLKEEKYRIDNTKYIFPKSGGSLNIPLKAKNLQEEFMLDIRRNRIELKKNTFQNRVKKEIVLARLDLGGAPHRNPDGEEMPCPHLHLYKEGFGDRWAYPLSNHFTNPADVLLTLEEFMHYCNIVEQPNIQGNRPYEP
jgi:hypothetical protein